MDKNTQINQKYDAKKWKKIMDTTQSNYANMIKRLERKQRLSNFVLIYYSIFLIINTLTGKYFPVYFNIKVAEYFGIILSVIMLAYSLINNSANYSVRISNVEEALNRLKTVKRELSDDNLKDCIDRYNKITDSTERRSDVDFFITVKHLCKEYDISVWTKKRKNKQEKQLDSNEEEEYKNQEKVVNNYVSEINVWMEEAKIVFEKIWELVLYLIPLLIFGVCVVLSVKGRELMPIFSKF